jgi:DNA-binding response OmpR family regulator
MLQPSDFAPGSTGTSTVPSSYRVGDLVVDLCNDRVTRDGAELTLPKLSIDLLAALVRSAPYLVTTDRLMDSVWKQCVGPEVRCSVRRARGHSDRDVSLQSRHE